MGIRYEDFWYNYTLRELWNAVEGFFEGEKAKDIRVALIVTSIENKPVHGYKIQYKPVDKRFPWLFNAEGKADVTDEDIARMKKHMKEENKKI